MPGARASVPARAPGILDARPSSPLVSLDPQPHVTATASAPGTITSAMSDHRHRSTCAGPRDSRLPARGMEEV